MAKSIMIQGTMSNAGKSLIAAGLCRIFHQDGYRVAPFKAQNMALNSYITRDGLEMGRAQVMQAECAGIEPDVRMNPILLKPTTDTGSQVIVNGEVIGNMPAREYFRYKPKLIPAVTKAYNELAAENDIIVIEGAGSPAEINLKDDDCFVNMGMAKIAHSPVLLVGDIDRGGVFAQLVGTVELLEPDEKAMVRGLVINKFRGDKTILDPGIDMLEKLAGIPVFGVVPYMNIEVDDEDSLSARLTETQRDGLIDIAVIRLPHISNFTDFNPLDDISGVSVRYVKYAEHLGNPDMIILPGTKNTMGDLRWLRECGLEAVVKKRASSGTTVMGICGGFQMLGKSISDPDGVEEGGLMRGLELLPVRTIFEKHKTRTRVTGHFENVGGIFSGLSGTPLSGYEIHMGKTVPEKDSAEPLTCIHDVTHPELAASMDGAQLGNVYGTYVHGCFDEGSAAAGLIECLARSKGVDMKDLKVRDYRSFKESQYDILADTLRQSMDIPRIYTLLQACEVQ